MKYLRLLSMATISITKFNDLVNKIVKSSSYIQQTMFEKQRFVGKTNRLLNIGTGLKSIHSIISITSNMKFSIGVMIVSLKKTNIVVKTQQLLKRDS